MVERTPVKSSNIVSVGYDPDGKTLHIEYTGGHVYHYHDVDKSVHDDMIASKSVGGFVHANIKNNYKHSRTEE